MVPDLVPSYAPNTDLFFKREFRIPAAQDNEVETPRLSGFEPGPPASLPLDSSNDTITSRATIFHSAQIVSVIVTTGEGW